MSGKKRRADEIACPGLRPCSSMEPGDFNSYYYKAPRTIIAGFGDSALAERTSAGLVPVVALERPDTVTSFRELR
jgi:hypothetical protein